MASTYIQIQCTTSCHAGQQWYAYTVTQDSNNQVPGIAQKAARNRRCQGSIKERTQNEHRNGYWLSTKWVLASDQSSVRSWLVQPIKELSSAAGLCAGRGCALIRQLANWLWYLNEITCYWYQFRQMQRTFLRFFLVTFLRFLKVFF